MSKVIKILINFLSIAILSILGLLILLSVAIEIPVVQNFVVHKAASILSEKLGTRIEIGHVRLKLFSRAEIEHIYIEDLHGDTLASIDRLDVGVRNAGLAGGAIALGRVELEGTRFYLHQVTDSTSNLAEILAKLKSDKPKEKKGGQFAMTAASIKIEDLKFQYYKLHPQPREYGVNFSDLEVSRLDLDAERFSIVGDSISLQIHAAAIKERKSGFQVDKLSVEQLGLSSSGMHFEKLDIATPHSRVAMRYLDMDSDSWKSYSSFTDSVHIRAGIDPSTVSYATIAYFAPGLRDWKSVYRNVAGEVSGTVADMKGQIDRLSTLETELKGIRFNIKGLPDVNKTNFKIDIASLHTSSGDALWLMRDITRKELPASTAQMLHRLGTINFSGHFDGRLDRFAANGNLLTSQGGADLNLGFAPQAKGLTEFNGRVHVHEFNLGALLDNDLLGRTDIQGDVSGVFGNNQMALDADAGISSLVFNGYRYHDIGMKGKFENSMFTGQINSSDPNIDFDFDGQLAFADSLPRYDFDMNLRNADLHKLGFNKRDSISQLSCTIRAAGSGTTLDNINGQIAVDRVLYINPTDSIRTGRVLFKGVNTASSHQISMQSSFADLQFNSRMGYQGLFAYLTEALTTYIPTLAVKKEKSDRDLSGAADANQFYLVKLKIKEANNVAGAILPGLILANGTELSFMLNPTAEQLSLMLQSEYIEWNRMFTSNLTVNSRNQADSLSLFVRADDLYAGGFYMPKFSVIGGIKENRVNVTSGFTDAESGISALVGARAEFRKSPSGMQQISLRLNPSYLTNKGETWRLSSGEVVYDSTRIDVERLRIVGTNGELVAAGVLSHEASDTLHVSLSNFNLEPLTQFTRRLGYSLSGISNGHADVVSALDKGMMTANLTFDSLKLNEVELPPLHFGTRWDFQNERARMTLTDRSTADTLIQAFYRPTDKRYMADVRLKRANLALLDPFLEGIIKNTHGRADVNLQITSLEGQPNINGTIRIPSLTTTVDFTNVPYTITNGVITAKDNNFVLKTTKVKDREGNEAPFDATFNLSRGFSNYEFDLRLKPQNMLVLGTTAQQNDLFSGKVYASGAAAIRGSKRGVSMNITATTAGNSSFLMSLSSKSNIANADFITFIPFQTQKADTSYYQERKQRIINRAGEKKNAAAGSLSIDMALSVLPNTDFQLVIDPTMGRGIRAQGNGQLNITVDPRNGEFQMYGDYQITEGSYNLNLERVVDRTFTIQPGSTIRWTGDPADALLDVTALYKVKASLAPLVGGDAAGSATVDCMVHLTDRLLKPTIGFEVEVPSTSAETQNIVMNALNTPELMSTQFLWLVAFGGFYSDNSGSQSFGTMSGSATVTDFLSSQISNMISSNKFNIGFKYRPKDSYSSDEVGINMSGELVRDRLFYDIEGNYDTENNAAATANPNSSGLSGDFAIRYLVDSLGSFQAKLFSRTIDTYDENQGLQETGAGLYYHEDFNTFSDIIRNMRERFSGKKKKNAASETTPEKTTNQSK